MQRRKTTFRIHFISWLLPLRSASSFPSRSFCSSIEGRNELSTSSGLGTSALNLSNIARSDPRDILRQHAEWTEQMGVDSDNMLLHRLQPLITGDFSEALAVSDETSVFTSRTDVSFVLKGICSWESIAQTPNTDAPIGYCPGARCHLSSTPLSYRGRKAIWPVSVVLPMCTH